LSDGDGGWKTTISAKEWDEIKGQLTTKKQPLDANMKKMANVLMGVPVGFLPDSVDVEADFDVAGAQKANKPTIDVAKEMGMKGDDLTKIETAVTNGELSSTMEVPNPPAGSVMLTKDPRTQQDRMVVFTGSKPVEVKVS
jgi:hypothetical protein